MLKVSGSISTKSTVEPQYNPQFADATKLFAEVQSQSFFFNPNAMQAECNALVALLKTTEYFELIFFDKSFSNFGILGPVVIKLDFKVLITLKISF